MRNVVKSAIVLMAMAFIIAGIASGQEKPWFDMHNCDLCKPFMEDPNLMPNMEMEDYEISNGIVTVTNVKEELLPSYRAAHGKMMANLDRIAKGDTLQLCGLCTAIGGLMERGAKYEYIETKHGDLSIMTAQDSVLIADVKAIVAKNKEEMMKMEAMKKMGEKQD